MRAGGMRAAAELVDVGVHAGDGRFVAPRVGEGPTLLLVPGRRLLPLGLGGEPDTVRTGEGVGLEPGDVDHGPVRREWLARSQTPLGAEVRRPRRRSRDVVLLLPRPALVRPPLAALVAAALDEREVGGVGDRGLADQVAADVGAVAGAFVVVGKAALGSADVEPA